jgi:hypothetical protein
MSGLEPTEELTMRRSTVVWLVLGALAPATVRAATPVITFEEAAVVASGLEPASRVAWFSVAREPGEYVSRIVRREAVLADDDGDGTVRLELDAPVSEGSVWFAVDLADGALTVASPTGEPFRERVFDSRVLRQEAPGVVRGLREGRLYLLAFLARPDVGAWTVSLGDGGDHDDDGTLDGFVQAAFASMESVDDALTPPEALATGDVVILVDPNAMEFAAVQFVK